MHDSASDNPKRVAKAQLVPYETLLLKSFADPEKTCYVLHAGLLHSLARSTAEAIDPTGSVEQQRNALTAIILAATSVEAYIHDLVAFARTAQPTPRTALLLPFIDGRVSSNAFETCAWVKFLLSGTAPDRGAEPFQSYQLLVQMRNRIVHAHPSKIVGLTSKDGALIDRLRSQQLTASSSTNTLHHFMSAHVARFACNAARAMIRDLARDQPMDGITDGQVLLILPPALASGPDMSKLDVMFPALPDLPAPTDPCVTLGRGAIDIDLLEVEARQTPDLPT